MKYCTYAKNKVTKTKGSRNCLLVNLYSVR